MGFKINTDALLGMVTGFVGCGNKGVVRKKEGGKMDRGFRSTHFARAVVGSLIIKKI